MKKQLLALGLALLLLGGCSSAFGEYPRASSQPVPPAAQTLTINLPADADATLQDSVTRLAAAVLELSGGNITLEPILSSSPGTALRAGDATLAVLTNQDLAKALPSLAFLDFPMLFASPEDFLTILGGPDSVVRGSAALRQALGGQVLGVWYGGSASLLCRGFFYDDICFTGATVGLMEGMPGGEVFTGMDENLAAKATLSGDPDTLLGQLESKNLKYVECFLGSGELPVLPPEVKYLERTQHRIRGLWLVLREGAVDQQTAAILQDAMAYTHQPQLEAVLAAEEAQAKGLEAAGLRVKSGEYANFHKAAKDYYRKHYTALGVPQRTWQQLRPLV